MPNERRHSENELTDGWPQEEGNDQLEAFARRLRDELPVLSETSRARVKRSVDGELDRRAFGRRTVMAAALAASIAIAAGILSRPEQKVAGPPQPAPSVPVQFVHDDYELSLEPARDMAAPTQPLIALDQYQALIGDEQLTQR